MRLAALIATLCGCASALAHEPDPKLDFLMHCLGCHGADGTGVRGKIPSLKDSMPAFVRSPEGRAFLLSVPGASNSSLTDAELAGVMNWLIGQYAPDSPAMAGKPFTTAEVSAVRRPAQTKVRENRARLLESLRGTGPLPSDEY